MKKNSLPAPIIILILTLLTAILWVGLNIYRTVTVKPLPPIPEKILKPLTPTLNTSVIQKIESAIFLPDSQIPPISITVPSNAPAAVVTAKPLPTVTPEASPSASPKP